MGNCPEGDDLIQECFETYTGSVSQMTLKKETSKYTPFPHSYFGGQLDK